MKTYEEKTISVLRKIEEEKALRKRRGKKITVIVVPAVCLCVAAAAFGLHRADAFGAAKSGGTANDAVMYGETAVEKSNSSAFGYSAYSKKGGDSDTVGYVVVNGETYIQFGPDIRYTPESFIGYAADFEGAYKSDAEDKSILLYTAKEDANVLIVQFYDGSFIVLKRQ